MTQYWVTIGVPADNMAAADHLATELAKQCGGRVIQIDHEPPQGSLIVGDLHEDEL